MDIDIEGSNEPEARRTGAGAIPQASLRRLAQYHHVLVQMAQQGVAQVSCSVIGHALNCIPVQVRKDLQYTGIIGRPKTGYSVPALITAIETFLGWDRAKEAFLVGVGRLGTALLGHERFTSFGLKILLAFDTDPLKIGNRIFNTPVMPMANLPNLARGLHIHLGIITTPAEAAQGAADALVKGGILAIWNFAPVRLRVPDNISVHNEDLYSSLASLSWQLAQRLREAERIKAVDAQFPSYSESILR